MASHRAQRTWIVGLAACTSALALGPGAAHAAPADTTPVSRATGLAGVSANGFSGSASISADGRHVAFQSEADNLSSEDGDAFSNVFVRDRQTQTTTLVSRATGAAGAPAADGSVGTSISADGRYVAFASNADNLSAADDDAVPNVFVRDLQLATTTYVSRATGATGAAGDDSSLRPAISADGRYVAFDSSANSLSAEDTDGTLDVYVRDLQMQTTTLASRATGATSATGDAGSSSAAISADGRHVAFGSVADNLSAQDDDAVEDVYVRDLHAATTTLASRATGASAAAGDGASSVPSISADGRHVAFGSAADNLSAQDDDAVEDVYVRDLQASTTTLASRDAGAAGAAGDRDSFLPSISADGSRVAFVSAADNLSAEDGPAVGDVFVRAIQAQTTGLVSRASGAAGASADGDSFGPAISQDGLFVAFESVADNLSTEDDDAPQNVFVRDISFPAGAVARTFPRALAFGDQQVGTTSAARTFEVVNEGATPLTIMSMLTAGPFALVGVPGCATVTPADPLDPGESCTIAVAFRPTAAGVAPGAASVSFFQTGPHSVGLTGSGIAASGAGSSGGGPSGAGAETIPPAEPPAAAPEPIPGASLFASLGPDPLRFELRTTRFVAGCRDTSKTPRDGICPESEPIDPESFRDLADFEDYVDELRKDGVPLIVRTSGRARGELPDNVARAVRRLPASKADGVIATQSPAPGSRFVTSAARPVVLKVAYYDLLRDDHLEDLARTAAADQRARNAARRQPEACKLLALSDTVLRRELTNDSSSFVTVRQRLKADHCRFELTAVKRPGVQELTVTGVRKDLDRRLILLELAAPFRNDLVITVREAPEKLTGPSDVAVGEDGALTVGKALTSITFQVLERSTGRFVPGASVTFLDGTGAFATRATDKDGEVTFRSRAIESQRPAVVAHYGPPEDGLEGYRSVPALDRDRRPFRTMAGRALTFADGEYRGTGADLDAARRLALVPANLGTGGVGRMAGPAKISGATMLATINTTDGPRLGQVQHAGVQVTDNVLVAAAAGVIASGGGNVIASGGGNVIAPASLRGFRQAGGNPVLNFLNWIVAPLRLQFGQPQQAPAAATTPDPVKARVSATADELSNRGAAAPPEGPMSVEAVGINSALQGFLAPRTGQVIAVGGGNVIATGGGNIIATGGGNIIATGGGNIIATGGGNIIATGGGNIIASGGGNLMPVGGNTIIASGGGN